MPVPTAQEEVLKSLLAHDSADEEEDESPSSSPAAASDEASPPTREPAEPKDSPPAPAAVAASPALMVSDQAPYPDSKPQPSFGDDAVGHPVDQHPGDHCPSPKELVELSSDEEGGEGKGAISPKPRPAPGFHYPDWYDPREENSQLAREHWIPDIPSPEPAPSPEPTAAHEPMPAPASGPESEPPTGQVLKLVVLGII